MASQKERARPQWVGRRSDSECCRGHQMAEYKKKTTLRKRHRLHVSAAAKNKKPVLETKIENLNITVRQLTKDDIKNRNLPNQTSGLVITKVENNSPLKNSIEVNSIILEAQKKKIRTVQDLNQVLKQVLNSNQKTILLVIYNSQNQKRYIGVKLD